MALLGFAQPTKYSWIAQELKGGAKGSWNHSGPRICTARAPSSWCLSCVTFPGDIWANMGSLQRGNQQQTKVEIPPKSKLGEAVSILKLLQEHWHGVGVSSPSAPVTVFWVYNLEELQALYNLGYCLLFPEPREPPSRKQSFHLEPVSTRQHCRLILAIEEFVTGVKRLYDDLNCFKEFPLSLLPPSNSYSSMVSFRPPIHGCAPENRVSSVQYISTLPRHKLQGREASLKAMPRTAEPGFPHLSGLWKSSALTPPDGSALQWILEK